MFSKLLHKILINKRNILLILGGISLFFILSDSAFAAEQTATFNDTKRKIGEVLQFITAALAVFLALITYLTTMFLSPEWINGSLFGLNKVFKDIWILVSNLVYLIFAFILIWIAFMNIIGKGQDKYALKQALPKFIVGILIVPFSWFLVNFILSISSVLTVSALSLPFDNFSTYWEKVKIVKIPTACVFNINNLGKTNDSTQSTPVNLNKILDCGKSDTFKDVEHFMSSSKSGDSIFGVIALYTYGVVNLESFDNLNESYQKDVKNMVDLVIKLVFDFLFIIVYSVLMIALGLVLMTRGIYLWIYMMISPIFGLMYFFDKTDGGSGFFEKFNLKQFISLAFVPVFTMLALSFGLLFLFVVGNGMTSTPIGNIPISNISIAKNTFKINEISLTISGSLSSDSSVTGLMKVIGDSVNGGLGTIGSLILKIFGIVILWGAVMAALRTNDITKAVVEPLYQFGSKVGELATKAPQYAPIFGGQSMQSISNIGDKAQGYFSNRESKRTQDFLEKHELFGSDSYTGAMQINKNNARAATTGSDTASVIEKTLRDMKGNEVKVTKPEFKELLDVIANNDKSGANDDFRKYIKETLKGKTTLSYDEAAKALGKLENPNISLGFNGVGNQGIGYEGQLIDYIKSMKDGGNPNTPPTGGNTNQTINLNIKNGSNSLPITLNNVNLTDKQKTDISSIDISTINTKANMIKELNKIGITETSVIENIIKSIDPTGLKFTS